MPVKHGITTWLRTGRLNPSIRGHKKLERYLIELEKDLIKQVGELTPAKEILIKSTLEAFGVFILASVYCKKHGVLRPDCLSQGVIELQPVLGKQFLAFLNTLRQNLVALGLDRQKAEEIIDLRTYIEIKENQNGKGSESGQSEIVDSEACQGQKKGEI